MVKGYETKEDDINKNYILSSSLSELFEKRTGEKEVKNKYQLLIDVQYIIDHLNVLNINYVDAPAGLSSLQIVRLLLRTGFPYINDEKKSIHRRFERIVKEMDNTNIFKSQKNTNHDHGKGNSIDGACTICTATAVSCFALAGEALPENFSRYKEKALTWLSQDNMYKWNWIYIIYDQLEALPYNHAMNYTSSVLLSFLDSGLLKKNYDNANDTNIQLKNTWRCFDTFFETKEYEIERNSPDKFKNGFIEKWMQHRNERPEEVLQYILSTFIKVCLCFPEKFRKNEIIKKISAQIKYLYILLRDISDEKENIWRLYTARENIECLCFMMLLGKDSPILPQDFKFRNSNNYRIIIKAATDIIERFRLQIKHQTLRESRIFDSNIDRSRKFLEGWLTYWEVTLFLSEKN